MLEEPIRMSSGCERLQTGTTDAFNGHVTNAADSYNGHVAGATSGYQAPLHSPPPPAQVSPPSQQRSSPPAPPGEDHGRDRDSLYAQYGYPPPLLGGGYPNSNSYTEKLHDSSNANGINNGSSADRGINDNGSINGESRHESRDAGGPPHPVRPECNAYSPNSTSQFVPPKPEPEVATSAGYVGTGDVGSDDRRGSPPAAVGDGSPMLRVRDLTSRSDSVLRFSERRLSISEPDHGPATETSAPPQEPDQDTSGTSKPASHSSDPSEYDHPAEDDVDRSREAYDPDGYDNNGENFGTSRESYDGNRESYDSRDAFGNTVDAFGREKAGEIDVRGEGVPGLNALARLQHALEKNGTFNVYKDDNAGLGGGEIYQCHLCSYTGSSKFHFSQHMHSHYDFKCSQCDFSTHSNITLKDHMKEEHNIEIKDFMDEPGVRVPRVNASGKVRLHKCKFCDFKTATQVEHWEHLKSHIAPEKRFWCHVCPFITDVKHHLTYHLRNHFNSKPFKCNKCEYSCVNKSMLSSHMKSHTNFYQYRCGDCNFAAKYANALKNHLRKEKHRPGMVLNPDGSPNPFVIIDVYGTRRGPKIKKDDNGMPILPTSLQENYVSFIQNQKTLMTSPNGSQFSSPYVKSEHQTLTESPDKLAIPRGFIRCDMCPYSTPDREQLTKHMMNHMTPDSQQEASPASSKSGDDGRELAPQPPKELPGLGRMELLRSALAQPVRLNPPATSSPPPLPPPPPPAYRRPEPPQPPAELPRLPQYDSLAAHRVREYFSRALQTPFLYNLQVAAGLNNGSAPSTRLPLPFSMGRPGPPPPLPPQHQSAAPPSPPHTRVSPRPSSPPFYERAPTQQQESPQPSSPPPGPDTALDLSRLGKRSSSDESPPPPAKHRRKGRAQKLEIISQRLQEGGGSPLYSTGSRAGSSSPERDVSTGDWKAAAHTCHSCGIAFKDLVMYTMHMGFHDYRRPFSCNKCGEECRDAIAFFLHIARVPHSS